MKRLAWFVVAALVGGTAVAQDVGQGIALFNEGRYAEAEPVLRSAAAPGATEAGAYLAATLVRLGRHAEAETQAKAVLETDAVQPVAVAALGEALVMQEKLDPAIARMTAALTAKNDLAYAYYWRGQAYHRTKQAEMEVLPDARELLDALRRVEMRLGIISAGLQVKQAEKLIRLRVLPYFDPKAIFFSDQMGVSKPNPKIYLKALAALGVEPSRAMYVGDRPGHDIAPAHQIGMRTVLYRGAGGKYAEEAPAVPADHDVRDMRDMIPILRDRYGVGAP